MTIQEMKFLEYAMDCAGQNNTNKLYVYNEESDLDRLYYNYDGEEYFIRMWNISNRGINFSVFKSDGSSASSIYEGGRYLFPKEA